MALGSVVIVDSTRLEVHGMGDSVYDDDPVSQAVLDKQPDAKVVVPPHKTAAGDTQRDAHIEGDYL